MKHKETTMHHALYYIMKGLYQAQALLYKKYSIMKDLDAQCSGFIPWIKMPA